MNKKKYSSWRSGVLLIAQREITDQFRDWRIITPIALMTLIFPILMNFAASAAINFVSEYGATLIAERLVPFLLMVVGFFPVSISLVIALESFAGERERLTIEPLFTTPLTDSQLYFGKLMASLFVPLVAAYLGIAFYLTGLYFFEGWTAPLELLILVIALNAVQAYVMVSGAVVVSSQVTSVRGANLLASFIILPMAQLVIGESLVMFWADYGFLWWVLLGLCIIGIILARMGFKLFHREELLGRDIDILNPSWILQNFKREFLQDAGSFYDWYLGVLRGSLSRLKFAAWIMAGLLLIAIAIGVCYAYKYQLPADILQVDQLDQSISELMAGFGLVGVRGWLWVVWNNIRAILLATILGSLTFGSAGVILLGTSFALIGYIAGNLVPAGQNAVLFMTATVLPHAIVEIPAAVLGGAVIINMALMMIYPREGITMGIAWINALAEWARVFTAVIVPLILVAAAIEVYITPIIADMIF